MNPTDPAFRPPGLPTDAQRLLSSSEILNRDLEASKLRFAAVPLSHHDLSLVVNGLALLESVSEAQQTPVQGLAANALQKRLRTEIPFAASMRAQMHLNRQILELPPL